MRERRTRKLIMLSEVMTRATCSTSSSMPYDRLVNKVNQAHQSDEARTLREALDGVTDRARTI